MTREYRSTNNQPTLGSLVIGALLVLVHWAFLPNSAGADTLWSGTSGAGIPNEKIRVLKIEAGKIFYDFQGSTLSKELTQVRRLQVDSETALTEAETAYGEGKLDKAVDAYLRAFRGSSKPWVKDWSAMRLLETATKANRFDAAATAYVHLLLRDPNTARQSRPTLPDAKSTYLDSAIRDITAALQTSGITDEQKLGLLNFALDMHRIRGDKAAETKTANQVDEILAKDPSNPAAQASLVRRKLVAAQQFVDAKDFAKAIVEIDAARAQIIDPIQQAEALFILAEAKFGIADASKTTEDLKDAALAYMRVVAHFKDSFARPRVVESLLKTAAIHQMLGENDTARQIYQQIVQQFPDDPLAAKAKAALEKTN